MSATVVIARVFSSRCFAIAMASVLLAGCSLQEPIHYPRFSPDDIDDRVHSCVSVDRAIQQVDSIRWSMRQDGTKLQTDFEKMLQLTSAAVAAVTLSVATTSFMPEPFYVASTNPEKLKKADALLIALLAKRRNLHCPSIARCKLSPPNIDTLSGLESMRKKVESKELSERQGLEELTELLDDLCAIGSA